MGRSRHNGSVRSSVRIKISSTVSQSYDLLLNHSLLTRHPKCTAEHVFEIHMIKDYFYWLFEIYGVSCVQLQKTFGVNPGGMNGQSYNSAQKDSASQRMAEEMGSIHYLQDLFILQKDLNMLKGAVRLLNYISVLILCIANR